MGILTDAEVQELRDLWAEGLTETCTVVSPARPGETAATQTLPCAVEANGAYFRDQGGGGDALTRGVDATIWFERDAVIPRAALVTVASTQRVYEVGDVSQPGTYDPGISASAIWKRP
jgi:hypothetical protein